MDDTGERDFTELLLRSSRMILESVELYLEMCVCVPLDKSTFTAGAIIMIALENNQNMFHIMVLESL